MPPHPRVKQLEIHSLWTEKLQDENSKTIKGGGWALPRPHISHSQSQETSLITHAQKILLGGQRGLMSRDVPLRHLLGKIHLG